jgi:hypothetical protein
MRMLIFSNGRFLLLLWASLFLAEKYGCRYKPTQTGANTSILCWQHRPIWPKLEQHHVLGRHVADILTTFPAEVIECIIPNYVVSTKKVLINVLGDLLSNQILIFGVTFHQMSV